MNKTCRLRSRIARSVASRAAYLCLFVFAAQAQAEPITFTFTGLNGTAPFAISVSGNTDDVVPLVLPTHPDITAVMVNCSSSVFSITGWGTGMFTVPTVVFDNLTLGTLGLSVAVPGGLPSDVLDIEAPDFFHYQLTTSTGAIGPVQPSYVSFFMPTTLGTIELGSVNSVEFEAVVIPEPSNRFLVLGGFLLLLVLHHERKTTASMNG